MKYLFVLMMVCVFLSCERSTGVDNVVGLDTKIKLKEGQYFTFRGHRFYLNKIEDSRCPSDANCIRAGEAIASLTMDSNDTFQLCTGTDCKSRGVTDVYLFNIENAGDFSFFLELISIDPYPNTKSTGNKKKTATFRIYTGII